MKVRFMHPAIGAFAVRLPDEGALTVGRDGESVDIEISWDPEISRRHARLSLERGQLIVEDLGSRNGCWIGRRRLEGRTPLAPGSSVLLGETALIVPAAVADLPPTDPAETFEARSPLHHSLAVADAATQPHSELPELGLFSEDLELDLPEPLAPPTPAVVGSPSPRRDHAYFSTPSRVTVRADRAELARLWLEELSKGGLFVPTDDAPPVGSPVQVRFDLDGSPLDLSGQVVVLVPACDGGQTPAGAGLALPELLGAKGATLSAFIEGRSADLPSAEGSPTSAPTADLVDALARSAEILSLSERGHLYAVLGVTPECGTKQLSEASARAQAMLRAALPGSQPPQAARLEAALHAVRRVERILAEPATRIEHDFRVGHVRAPERLAAARAGAGPSVAELRRIWNQVNGDKVQRAAQLTREAFQARQEHNISLAVQMGERALALNPFFEELEKTVAVWRDLRKG